MKDIFHEDYPTEQSYMEKVIDGLPEEIETLLEDLDENNTERSNGQQGVTNKELAYHMLPGGDRRLGVTCTAKDVANEFNIRKASAHEKLNKLEKHGLLYKDEREGHLFVISPELRKRIDDFETKGICLNERDVATDGGVPRTALSLPNAPHNIDNKPSQLASTRNDSRLRERIINEVTVPIASLVGFFMIDSIVAGSASPLAAVLIMGIVWLLSKLAALPDHMPWETARQMDLAHSMG